MSSLPSQQAGIGSHVWFVVAMGIAAMAGYGWGSMGLDVPADAERAAGKPTKVRERPPEMRVEGPATARDVVRSVMDGSLDDRQHWRHVRSFTEEEVKEAIASLDRRYQWSSRTRDLAEMLFYRWGELAPVAANETAKSMFPEKFSRCREAVIAAWINQGGGVAAWSAVEGDLGMWDCTQSVSGEVAEMLVASLSDRDDLAAFKEVLKLDDDNCEVADLLCRARAGKAARTPESRAAFLAAADLHPRAFVRYSCARDELLKAWSELEPEAAEAASLIWEKERDVAQAEEDAREEAEWEKEQAAGKKESTGDDP